LNSLTTNLNADNHLFNQQAKLLVYHGPGIAVCGHILAHLHVSVMNLLFFSVNTHSLTDGGYSAS